MAKQERECAHCGVTFVPTVPWQKCCSAACRSARSLERRRVRVPEDALVVAITPDQQAEVLRDERADRSATGAVPGGDSRLLEIRGKNVL